METKQVLAVMKIFTWIIFIGLCIKAGAIILSTIVSLFVNPEAAKDIYLGLDLSSLYELDMWYYISVLSLIIAVALLKAYIFYLVIKIFLKINIDNPFNMMVSDLISKMSYIALSIGIISKMAMEYNRWLVRHHGISPISFDFGSNEFLFMAGILFIIAYIFKRGIEIQSENELTI